MLYLTGDAAGNVHVGSDRRAGYADVAALGEEFVLLGDGPRAAQLRAQLGSQSLDRGEIFRAAQTASDADDALCRREVCRFLLLCRGAHERDAAVVGLRGLFNDFALPLAAVGENAGGHGEYRDGAAAAHGSLGCAAVDLALYAQSVLGQGDLGGVGEYRRVKTHGELCCDAAVALSGAEQHELRSLGAD